MHRHPSGECVCVCVCVCVYTCTLALVPLRGAAARPESRRRSRNIPASLAYLPSPIFLCPPCDPHAVSKARPAQTRRPALLRRHTCPPQPSPAEHQQGPTVLRFRCTIGGGREPENPALWLEDLTVLHCCPRISASVGARRILERERGSALSLSNTPASLSRPLLRPVETCPRHPPLGAACLPSRVRESDWGRRAQAAQHSRGRGARGGTFSLILYFSSSSFALL